MKKDVDEIISIWKKYWYNNNVDKKYWQKNPNKKNTGIFPIKDMGQGQDINKKI